MQETPLPGRRLPRRPPPGLTGLTGDLASCPRHWRHGRYNSCEMIWDDANHTQIIKVYNKSNKDILYIKVNDFPDSSVMAHPEDYNAHEAHTSCKSLSEDAMSVDFPAWLAHVCCFPFCCRDVQYWNWNDLEYISTHSYHDHDVGDVWVDVPPKTKKAASSRENQLRGSENNKWKQPILLPRQAASSTEATEAAEAAASPSSSPSWGFVSNLHHTYTNYHRQNMTKCQGATPPPISKHLSTPNTQPFCFWGSTRSGVIVNSPIIY